MTKTYLTIPFCKQQRCHQELPRPVAPSNRVYGLRTRPSATKLPGALSRTARILTITPGDGIGGAIYNDGTLTVGHSTFSENGSLGGGGIYNVGTLKINHSTLSGNSAFAGGGLFTYPGSFASLTHNTFSGNFGFEGSGIANFGALKVNHGTLSGNAGGQGGGIFNADTLALNHSIITHNTANLGGGLYICLDGQVSVEVGLPCHGTLTLRHTSVTGNTPDDIFP